MSTDATNPDVRHDDNAPIRKFLFDRSFDDEHALLTGDRKQSPGKKIIYSAEQMETAKNQAYENGFNTGQKAVSDSQQKHMNVLLAQIDQRLAGLMTSNEQLYKQQLTHAQETALAIARKILPTYVNRQGLDEIESIVTQVMAERSHEPRLVLRVGEAQFDAISAKINALSEQRAFAGKVVILCEETLGASDCRVEWADGGIERDLASLWQTIDRIVGIGDQGQGVRDSNPEPPSPNPESQTPNLGDHE